MEKSNGPRGALGALSRALERAGDKYDDDHFRNLAKRISGRSQRAAEEARQTASESIPMKATKAVAHVKDDATLRSGANFVKHP